MTSGPRRLLRLSDWPVARRLFAVIVAALLMGLIFGGLRVADAENSASQFSQTEQLARVSQQLLVIVDDLQAERDATLVALATGDDGGLTALQGQTSRDLVPVRAALQKIVDGGFPATVATAAGAVNNALSADNIRLLHDLFDTALPDGDVVSPDYEAVISDIITLQEQVALGITDPALTSDVQTLSALSQARDLTSQQEADLDQSLSDGSGVLGFGTETNLQVAYAEELNDEAAFQAAATAPENAQYDSELGPQASRLDGEDLSDNLEQAFFTVASGNAVSLKNGKGPQIVGTGGISYPLFIANQPLDPNATPPTTAKQDGLGTTTRLKRAWDAGVGSKLSAMGATQNLVAANIVARATQLHQSAQRTAIVFGVVTALVLLIVLLAALLVARTLVLPLRRLRASALDIASVQLPARVRTLADDPDSAAGMQIAPIDVTSADEIGQVARAFDQVHAEAIRLAGEQALLRSSFNAMFINLSRRSQSLIERLARMIENLEHSEEDPDRLGSLFSMDHLVTRMRRNSENLLLLAGHENPRKWVEPAPLTDVTRAATAEIEQYNRITQTIPGGVSLIGAAVSDVVHLLAELLENATLYSPKDTAVHVTMKELVSGGVLIEIIDKGIGMSEARLTEMNWRLDNPPAIDVSVSRHMGLFAVARLAERHHVRVRLRPASPQGLSALVWLPDSIIERTPAFGRTGSWAAQAPEVQPVSDRRGLGSGGTVTLPASRPRDSGPGDAAPGGRTPSGWFRGQVEHTGTDPVPFAGPPPGWGQDREPDGQHSGEHTNGGLPLRTPKAHLPQGTPTARDSGATGTRGQHAATSRKPGGDSPLPRRSPDQARSRLSGFQRGARRAEIRDGRGGSGAEAPRSGGQ